MLRTRLSFVMIWRLVGLFGMHVWLNPSVALARVSSAKDLVTGPVKGIYEVPHVTIRSPTFVYQTEAPCECRVKLVTQFTAMTIDVDGAGLYTCNFTTNPRPFANVTISPNINSYFVKKHHYRLGSRQAVGNLYLPIYCSPDQRVPISSMAELRIIAEFVAEENPLWNSGWIAAASYDEKDGLVWPDGSVTTAEELDHEYALMEGKDLDKSCLVVDSDISIMGESCFLLFQLPNFICYSTV